MPMDVTRHLACLAMMTAVYNTLISTAEESTNTLKKFFQPPSPCLMGASCLRCVHTLEFYNLPVCCYHCRLDNLVISGDTCHCLDTRIAQSSTDIGGNCSSGQICDNCAVKMSSGVSEDVTEAPDATVYCCQDCGIVMPYLNRDEKGCNCVGDTQGRVHEAAPKYDPSNTVFPNTTTAPPDSGAGSLTLQAWTFGLVTSVLVLLAEWS